MKTLIALLMLVTTTAIAHEKGNGMIIDDPTTIFANFNEDSLNESLAYVTQDTAYNYMGTSVILKKEFVSDLTPGLKEARNAKPSMAWQQLFADKFKLQKTYVEDVINYYRNNPNVTVKQVVLELNETYSNFK